MFFVVESANIDPDSFAWLVFTRATKMRLTGYHQRHVLNLMKGDIFGVRRTRSNTYQMVKSDAMHILYRNLTERTYSSIMKNSIPYKGETPTDAEAEEGFVRRRKVNTRETVKPANKRVDDFFIPTRGRIVEKYQIDLSNYQWRKIAKSQIKIVTKKQGKIKSVLQIGDVVGMRYRSPARGGYVIVDAKERVHISHELYLAIVQGSRVVPSAQQRSGILDISSGKQEEEIKEAAKRRKNVKRPAPRMIDLPEEEPVEKLYDIDSDFPEELLNKTERRSRTVKNMRRSMKKLLDIPESETWVETDEQEGFEDEPQQETNKTLPKDEDEYIEEEGDDVEAPEEAEPTAEEEEAQKPVVDVLEIGDIIHTLKGPKQSYAVVDAKVMDRNENLMEYVLFDPASTDEEEDALYKLRIGVRMTLEKFNENATIEGKFPAKKLKSIQERLEYATFQPISLLR